jgi:hypothetical protein
MFFRSSIARPTDTPIYASSETSRHRPQDSGPRWNRFLLSCRALSSPTTCRFIPAHPGLPLFVSRAWPHYAFRRFRSFPNTNCVFEAVSSEPQSQLFVLLKEWIRRNRRLLVEASMTCTSGEADARCSDVTLGTFTWIRICPLPPTCCASNGLAVTTSK